MRNFLLLFFSLIIAAPTGAISVKKSSGSQIVTNPKTTELRIGINATDLETLDPHLAASFSDRMLADMIFNGLLRYKPGDAPNFEPDLAEEIPEPYIVDGRQIWTFKLKRGVFFHAGPHNSSYEFTADDVVYSLHKAADPKRSAYAGEYTGMSVEKIDDYTCNIIMDPPLSPTLFFPKIADYAGGFIVSSRALQANGDTIFYNHPVGTGPFRFTSHKSLREVLLTANSHYFRHPPELTRVRVKFLPDPIDLYTGFVRGELDLIRGGAEIGQQGMLPQDAKIDIFGVPEIALIHFNTSVKPLNDPRIRKAIAYALNRDQFLALFPAKTVGNVYAPIPDRFLPGGLSPAEVKSLNLDYSTDLQKSHKLLTQAGYPNGFSLNVIATELSHVHKNYEMLKAQLEKVGILINLQVVDHSSFHRKIRQNESAIVIYEAWRPNTDVFLSRFFHSDSIVLSGKNPDTNFSHYRKIDRLIELARNEMNPIKQAKLWEYAQIKLLEDMVVYPLHFRNKTYIRHNYVDYGHPLVASMALYPQVTENTRICK